MKTDRRRMHDKNMNDKNSRPPIVILIGPTAAGKTDVAVKWAEMLNGEIVSADSVQVYRYMDIGSAKPDRDLLERVPHHLVDAADPDDTFSAARFKVEADRAIESIASRGKTPLVVGGAGLFIRALTRGLFQGPGDDPEYRELLMKRIEENGVEALHAELEKVDPEAASRIRDRDRVRIIRGLEVYRLTGIPISRHQKMHGFRKERYQAFYAGIEVDRKTLSDRIERRIDRMMEAGLTDEVRGLFQRGYSFDLPSMQSIGYRHVGLYLKGETTLEDAVSLMKRDTRRYAKRQMTWFRKIPDVCWFSMENEGGVVGKIHHFLNDSPELPLTMKAKIDKN